MSNPLYSFSKLDCFNNCRRRFFFQYVQKIPTPPPNKFMQDGLRFHSMAENFHKNINIKELLRQGADVYLENFKLKTGKTVDNWFDAFIDHEKERYKVLLDANYPERFLPVFVEEKLIGEVAGVPFIGYVDRVDQYASDEYGVLDYKPSAPRSESALAKIRRQQVLYAELVKDIHDIEIKNWSAYYYKDHDYYHSKINKSSITNLKKWIRRTITAIQEESEYPKAQKDYYCRYCTFKENCRKTGDELVL